MRSQLSLCLSLILLALVTAKIDPQYTTISAPAFGSYYYVPDNSLVYTNSSGNLYLTLFMTSTYYNSAVYSFSLAQNKYLPTYTTVSCVKTSSFITSYMDSTGSEFAIVGCYISPPALVLYKMNPVTNTAVYTATFQIRGGLVPQFFPIIGSHLYLAEPTSFPSQNKSISIYSIDLSVNAPVAAKVASALFPWSRTATGNNITSGTVTPDRLVLSYYSGSDHGLFVYSWPPSSNPDLKDLSHEEEENGHMVSYLVLLRQQSFPGLSLPLVIGGLGDVGFVATLENIQNQKALLLTTDEYDINYFNGPVVSVYASMPTGASLYSSSFGGQPILSGCTYLGWANATNGFIVNELAVPYNRFSGVQVLDTYTSELTAIFGFAQKGTSMAIWTYNSILLFSTYC